MIFTIFVIFALVAAAFVGLLIFHRPSRRILQPVVPWLLRHFAYPVILQRARWTANGMTRLQALVIVIYIGTNVVLVVLAMRAFSAAASVANIALTNMALLLLGGRTNPIANSLGISLHTYYLFHHWAGRVASAQGITHCFESWPRAALMQRISGASLALSIALSCATSFWLVRLKVLPRQLYFPHLHFWLFIMIFATLIFHVRYTSPSLDSFSSILTNCLAAIFSVSQAIRLFRLFRNGSCRVLEVKNGRAAGRIARVKVRCDRPVPVQPGSYFYIFLRRSPLRHPVRSYLSPVSWWETDEASTLKEPIFFLDRSWADELSVQSEVWLDVPYGKSIDLSKYETVLLAADGIGISGILPFILSLAVRYERDKDDKSQGIRGGLFGDEFRKINIYWELGSGGAGLGKMVVQLLDQLEHKKAAKVRISSRELLQS